MKSIGQKKYNGMPLTLSSFKYCTNILPSNIDDETIYKWHPNRLWSLNYSRYVYGRRINSYVVTIAVKNFNIYTTPAYQAILPFTKLTVLNSLTLIKFLTERKNPLFNSSINRED